ncbi:sel1 repeat family protein [Hahella sp. KA22]|uniref:tetratricopeptide repeat protein n=1 Tax=Hahella sp. KA22 TaxID=1628392 RepID=UPI000FDEFA2B|nr:tetratricopeptide repeat protein [Hahella sp. KA22]AZZ94011.1 sel1 repeat family protein [Hahella sp. KA22]QAY57385.1 sel1 repeat family protein [Hahella sp. KA22]
MNNARLLEEANYLYRNNRFNEAACYYRSLASSGHYGSARRLGWMYLLGEGLDVNYSEALKWLSYAAKHDDDEAMFAIGWLYQSMGHENWQEAYKWFKKAAEKEFPAAIYRLAWMHIHCDDYSNASIEDLLIKSSSLGCLRAKRDLGFWRLKSKKGLTAKIRGIWNIVSTFFAVLYVTYRNSNDPRLLF